jgi:hypothetical protein
MANVGMPVRYGTVTGVLAAAPVRCPVALNLSVPAAAPVGMMTSAEKVPFLFAVAFPSKVLWIPDDADQHSEMMSIRVTN